MGLKKAIFFSVDALIASIILVSAMVMFSNLYIQESEVTHLSRLSNDALDILSELKISEVNNSYVSYLISQGEITYMNNTIIEQLGELWALNKTGLAYNLSKNITEGLFPENMGFSIVIGNEDIYTRDFENEGIKVASRKMISGYEKTKPIKGSTARAYLKSITQKKSASYAYFGGFVGQGNITKEMEYIPADAEFTKVFIELDSGSDFDLYINSNYCGTFFPSAQNMNSTRWDIGFCNSSFSKGSTNELQIFYSGDIGDSFIAGGYVKAEYFTKQLIKNDTYGIEYFQLPGINGLINYYSSFDIPGNLNTLDIYLHFYNNKSTFLNIGNDTIFNSTGSSTDQIINISGITLPLQPETIPIRMGTGNISENINVTSGEPADSVLVTDVSGSMDDCGLTGTAQFCEYDCYWWIFNVGKRECLYTGSCSGDQCGTCSGGWYSTSNHQVVDKSGCLKTKMELAKESDLQFVDTVLNISGNRVGLVSYEGGVRDTEPLTSVKASLENDINNYFASGGTCICCGINRAKDMLLSSTNKRFMVVMSDGQPTYYCNSFSDYSGSGNWGGDGTGGSSSVTDKQWAIDAGQEACDQGITVFTVGFGSDADQDTLKQIACNESLYYNASDLSNVTSIYDDIGNQILVIANYTSQIVTVSGDFQNSILYPDSFLRFNFTPQVEPPSFGEIEMNMETEKFDACSVNFNIPSKLRITEAKLLSYSGSHWTSYVSVNGNEVFNITEYGSDYKDIGDPFVVEIPPSYLNNGNNLIDFQTADGPSNFTGCSMNNSIVYTGAISSSISYSTVLEYAEGCTWTIETEESGPFDVNVPSDYTGNKICNYSSSLVNYSLTDSIDVSTNNLLENLDFDNNGKINIDITEQDLQIQALWVSHVPYLWGPAIVEVRSWQ